ncbi:uncharacterized protein F4812DRAFT_411217 [Daldinia caldariorum]|uniref:uncharacterized protein n=1 Tax=Daldinia caldariorum TaxID=326644 RepID=UPI002007CC92|nr:uncharacterized protein F4812DRAFT_411217 [Daldinia caldariorum]KAI1473000.1 hypothetical protein F4812DRAFT_411217 [Daldinia caldariorum]
MLEEGSDEDYVLVTQLPSDSWFEGFAFRPDGRILACRLDEPEIYTLNPEDPDSTPQLLHTFTEEDQTTGLVDAEPIPGTKDEYFVLSTIGDLSGVQFTDPIIWRVVLSPDDSSPPKITKLAEIPESGLCAAVIAITDRVVILPDSTQNCIWHVDTQTGKATILMADDSMKIAEGEGNFFGLNRICVSDEFIWFTNTSAGLLGRIPIERVHDDPAVGIRVSGPVQILSDEITDCDGLAITRDQTAAYTCSYKDGFIWKVNIEPSTGQTSTSVIVSNLASPTAVELGYVNGKVKLFIVCCGEIQTGWIQEKENPWSDIANINSAVTVQVETQEVIESI